MLREILYPKYSTANEYRDGEKVRAPNNKMISHHPKVFLKVVIKQNVERKRTWIEALIPLYGKGKSGWTGLPNMCGEKLSVSNCHISLIEDNLGKTTVKKDNGGAVLLDSFAIS